MNFKDSNYKDVTSLEKEECSSLSDSEAASFVSAGSDVVFDTSNIKLEGRSSLDKFPTTHISSGLNSPQKKREMFNLKRSRFDQCLKELTSCFFPRNYRRNSVDWPCSGNEFKEASLSRYSRFVNRTVCRCWKQSIFKCPSCVDPKSYWTWPAGLRNTDRLPQSSKHTSAIGVLFSTSYNKSSNDYKSSWEKLHQQLSFRKSSYGQSCFDKEVTKSHNHPPYMDNSNLPHTNKQTIKRKTVENRFSKRLVMEEQERKEEAERWRESDNRANSEVSTLPVKRPWLQHTTRVTTTAILEGARNLSSTDGPSLNGILPSGGDSGQRHHGEQIDPDDKPPKLVVNLNHSDKASQIPEPLPAPEPEIESNKVDEADGYAEQENSCLVDCLYITLQCCDCSIM